jgi:hypothetical protein
MEEMNGNIYIGNDEVAPVEVVTVGKAEVTFAHKSLVAWTQPTAKQEHKFLALADFCLWVRREHGADDALVTWDDNVVMSQSDSCDQDSNSASYSYCLSRQAAAWKLSIGRTMTQPQLKDFLECRLGEFNEPECGVYSAMTQLKLAKSIDYEATIDESNNYSVAFAMKDGKGCTKLAKKMRVTIPMFKGDPEAATLDFDIRYKQPTSQEDRAVFVLDCPTWDEVYEREMLRQIEDLKSKLPGYLVLNASPMWKLYGTNLEASIRRP